MNANEIVLLPLSSIKPNSTYTRAMEDAVVEQIAQSFKAEGQLDPIQVKACDDGTYEVVSGHHRLAAAKLLDWEEIKAVVLGEEKEDAVFYAANLFRSNLTPVDKAQAVIDYGKGQGFETDADLASFFGVTAPLISQLRSIHEHLEPEVKAFANKHRELTQVVLINASRRKGVEAQMAVINAYLQTLEKKKEKKQKPQPAGYDQEKMVKRLDTMGTTLEKALTAMHEAGKTGGHKEALRAMRDSIDEEIGSEVTVDELIDELKAKMSRLEVSLGGEDNPGQYLSTIQALFNQMMENLSSVQSQEDDAVETPSA